MSSDLNQVDDEEKAFDEAWDDINDEALDAEEPSEVPEPADDVTSSDPEPAAPDPDPGADSGADSQTEALKQKLRSAEGRLTQFEGHISDLRHKLAEREPPVSEPEPEQDTPIALPEGWTPQDWDDFSADNPIQAEFLKDQSRKVRELTDRLDTSEKRSMAQTQKDVFDAEIRSSHSDFDELMANERDEILQFIDSQPNPVLKSAYQTIYDRGSAPDIVELVTHYKQQRGTAQTQVDSQHNVDDALAVPSGGLAPGNSLGRNRLPSKDDEDGAWDYFKDDAID